MPSNDCHSLSRLLCGALAFSAVLAVAGCDAEPTPDASSAAQRIDLARHGVHEVVAADGGYDLLDASGEEIGRVVLHDDGDAGRLDVSLHTRTAEVEWSDAETALRCDGGAPTTISASAHGPSDAQQPAGEAQACDDALLVGFEVARAAGLTPPWDNEVTDDVSLRTVCQTVSTWVGGSSCSACASAAALDRGAGWGWTGGTCSSGTIYTTCSHTYCLAEFAPEVNAS